MIRPSSKERAFRIAVLIAGDFAIGWLALLATAEFLPVPWHFELDGSTVVLFACSLVIALALSGFYTNRVTPRTRPSIVTALVIQIALVALGGAALVQPLRRSVLVAVPPIELLALPLWRRLLRAIAPIRPRDTVLFGDEQDIEEALKGLRLIGDQRIRVIGSQTVVSADMRDAEEVICVSPHIDARTRLELLRIRGPRGFLMLASHADALLASRMLGWIGDQPLVEVGVSCGYGISAAIKRSIDVFGSTLLMIVTAPISILIAIAVRIDDRGPVFIRQQRVGLGGDPYDMWKFRSMANERVTRIGALLRRYHLDELPQLLNVFTGDMSLVGPRPERPELVLEILRDVPDFDLRCLVRPGIAGLAQVSAEYDTRPEVKLRYDLMYMCDWSVWLDLRLMLRAVSTSLAGTGR